MTQPTSVDNKADRQLESFYNYRSALLSTEEVGGVMILLFEHSVAV